MEWKLLNWKSARVMSHRVTSLGEAYPDTAFRQVVVRLESEQKLNLRDDTYSKSALHPNSRYSLKALTANSRRWIPEEASTKIHKAEPKLGRQINASRSPGDTKGEDQGEITRVVEYLVMQKRVINRKEDEKWKIWGFVEESTPQKLEDDDEYWRKYNSAQAAAVA
jgi:protein MBA1